jgi:TonB family protein
MLGLLLAALAAPVDLADVPLGQPAACANPFQDATVTKPVTPDFPDSARGLGLGPMTVLIQVIVGPSGTPIAAMLYRSSGNMAIDQAALRAARASTYAPKLVNCAPAQGNCIFRAEFNPGESGPLPTVMLSNNWKRASDRSWTLGTATINIYSIANFSGVAYLRASTETVLKRSGVTPVFDDIIRVCSNTRDAWRLASVARSGSNSAVTVTVVMESAGKGYGAWYSAPGTTVPDNVMNALLTLCPPK